MLNGAIEMLLHSTANTRRGGYTKATPYDRHGLEECRRGFGRLCRRLAEALLLAR